ncbi:hypothetical protein SAMD00079811_76290 (plasmid) [Scytonema sp. HK-05]|uniref:hypothetical protein n=1 Tax=Scytonema sp. HK-05 TaxID=1137095 RepID=UPI000B33CE47|nr:hypothetical protein [Scytonema sp. HK-05]BAY50000.1 hypothetical protein SAMD00079811_76290 [Scytonema sp. HK-05]
MARLYIAILVTVLVLSERYWGIQPWQALPALRALLAASIAFPGGTWKRDFISCSAN